MNAVAAIALNTFREAVRNKVFYTLLFFGVLFTGFSAALSTIIAGSFERMIADMGLANIELFGTLIAVFVGITLVYKEIELRTAYVILVKPIGRWQFVLGKFFGLFLTLIVEIAFMTALFLPLLAWFRGAYLVPWMLPAIAMITVQLMLVTAVAVFFSCLSTPILSGMFTIGVYLVGTTSRYLDTIIGDNAAPSVVALVRVVQTVAPNFALLNFKGPAVYQDALGWQPYAVGAAYGTAYTVAVLAAAVLAFERRELA